MVVTSRIEIQTTGQGDAHDLGDAVQEAVTVAGVHNGIACIFVGGSTAAVTTIELEPGAVADLNAVFERIVPRHADYRHHEKWGDDNGSSHVRAAMLGPSLTVPIENGRLTLGTWQQVMLLEFDTRERTREIIIQLIGEQR
jgi:secondary thiamine-phosphate synthase enzyme